MPRDTPYAGVAAIFRSALEAGRAPRVFEDGGQQRDFVHVTDVADANLRGAAGRPARTSSLRAYNVASGPPAHRRGHGPGARRRLRRPGAGGHRRATGSATCGTSSRARCGRSRNSASGRGWSSRTACARSRPIPSGLLPDSPGAADDDLDGDRAAPPTPASQNRCDRGGSDAVAGSSHTRNGSQIRSVSPSTSPEASLTAMPASAARGRTSSRPRSAGQSGDDRRAGRDRRRGGVGPQEVGRMGGAVVVGGAVPDPLGVDDDAVEPPVAAEGEDGEDGDHPDGCAAQHPQRRRPAERATPARGRRPARSARPRRGRRTGRGTAPARAPRRVPGPGSSAGRPAPAAPPPRR